MLNPLKSMAGRHDGPIEFAKMAGAGNDFVVIDDRAHAVKDPAGLARAICSRRLSVGADGIILVENSARATFRMRYFNADGSVGDFCGNGTRCAARFAFMSVIAPRKMTIETDAGVVGAEIVDRNVELHLPSPRDFTESRPLALASGRIDGSFIVVGVPHYVTFLESGIWDAPVGERGREIRFHPDLRPEGANVDWVEVSDRGSITVRTYERGVEDETLSCGSGVMASVAVGVLKGLLDSPVSVMTRSGIHLEVGSSRSDSGAIAALTLRGDARIIYRAELTPETIEGFDPDWVRKARAGS